MGRKARAGSSPASGTIKIITYRYHGAVPLTVFVDGHGLGHGCLPDSPTVSLEAP